jgi:hypothetical protein
VTERNVLVLRLSGYLWGVDHAAVSRVVQEDGFFQVDLGAQRLVADQILGIVEGMATRPAGSVLTTYWGEAAEALGIYGTTPLVVIDPERPPAMLRLERQPAGN